MWNASRRVAGFDIGDVFEISTGYTTKYDETDEIWARDPVHNLIEWFQISKN